MNTRLIPETDEEWLEQSIKDAEEATAKINQEQSKFGYALTSSLHEFNDAIERIGRYYFSITQKKKGLQLKNEAEK
jgi:hypothetical protein